MTRLYIPYNFDELGQALFVARMPEQQGNVDAGISASGGHAVTDELRRALPDLDDEGLEHYAMTEAAQQSIALVDDDFGHHRRMVLAVDVSFVVTVAGEITGVESDQVVIPRDLVALLVDTDDATGTVRRAAKAVKFADDDAADLVEQCLDHELAWYAAAEVDVVMGLS